VLDAFPGVELCDDLEAAAWLRPALRPWTDRGIRHVSTLVPADYAAHGRILHRGGTRSDRLRWAEIAAQTGRQVEADTQYAELVGWHADAEHQSPPDPWSEPERGSLLPDECSAVARVLARYTAMPDDCFFCIWEGYGSAWTVLNRLAERAPRVTLEHRDCLLFRGPVGAATAFREGPWFQSPTVWWPADRAWCVASELDIYSTYVAATPAAMTALVDDPLLEIVECRADDDIDHGPYAAVD
jgi:hypothetical protein